MICDWYKGCENEGTISAFTPEGDELTVCQAHATQMIRDGMAVMEFTATPDGSDPYLKVIRQ